MSRVISIAAMAVLMLSGAQTTTSAPDTTAAFDATDFPDTTTAAPETTPAPEEDEGQTDASATETRSLTLPLAAQAALPTLLPTLPWARILNTGGGFWYYNNGVRTYFPLSTWFVNTFRPLYPLRTTSTVIRPVVSAPVVTSTVVRPIVTI